MFDNALNFRQKMVVLAMDVLLITELAFAMYLGHQDPENLTVIFLKTFAPAAAMTVLGSRWLIRRFHK
jgi:hypothetical protein